MLAMKHVKHLKSFKYVLIPRISQTLLIDKTFVNIIIKLRHPSILELCVVLLYCWKNLV